jgi:diguanylate cyclase (GGDEF)-like protein
MQDLVWRVSLAPAPKHPEEEVRLKILHDLGLVDTPPEERFDRITRLAQRIFKVPMATISLVDEHRQFFKSHQGIDVSGTPRDISFCEHTILQNDVMMVPDTQEDMRFRNNPLVVEKPNIRMYAGCSIRLLGGPPVGVLCVMDEKPRTLTEEEIQNLRDLTIWVEHEMNAMQLEKLVLSLYSNQEELRVYQDRLRHVNRILKRLASADGLTGIPNRLYFEEHLAEEFLRRRRSPASIALVMVDVDHFKDFNDTYGHLMGDECLAQVARVLDTSLKRPADFAARFGGEEFVIVLPDTDAEGAEAVVKEIVQNYRQIPLIEGMPSGTQLPSLSMGVAILSPEDSLMSVDLLDRADKALYASKAAGRNRVTFWPPDSGSKVFL